MAKHVKTAIRLLVCVGALTWVLYNVTYYDHVHLTDGSQRLALSVEKVADGFLVRGLDGRLETIPIDRVATSGDGAPDIQFGLRRTVLSADHWTLALCILVFAPVPLIQSWRFQLMLRVQDIRISFWESAKLCYAGNFFNFVTAVGSTGGDMLKMYYTSLHTDRKTEAVATVFLDRVIGLIGVVSLVGVLMLTRSGDPKLSILRYGFVALFVGCVGGALLVFSPTVRRIVKLQRLLSRLRWVDHLRRADASFQRLADRKGLTAASLGLTFVLQLIALTAMTLAAKALHMRWDAAAIWDYYTYLAAGIFVAAVPISPQGLGTMEAFYKFAFLPSHGTLAAILCLAMTVRALNLFWSLPGVLVALTGRHRPSRNAVSGGVLFDGALPDGASADGVPTGETVQNGRALHGASDSSASPKSPKPRTAS